MRPSSLGGGTTRKFIPATPARSTSHIVLDRTERDPSKVIEALVAPSEDFAHHHYKNNNYDKHDDDDRRTAGRHHHQFSDSTKYNWGGSQIVSESERRRQRKKLNCSPSTTSQDDDIVSDRGRRSPFACTPSRSRSRSPIADSEDDDDKRDRPGRQRHHHPNLRKFQKQNDPVKKLPPLKAYYRNALPPSMLMKMKKMKVNSTNDVGKETNIDADDDDDDVDESMLRGPATTAFRTLFFGTSDVEEQEAMIQEMIETGRLRRLQQPQSTYGRNVNTKNDDPHSSFSANSPDHDLPPQGVVHPNHPRYKSRYHVPVEPTIKPPPNEKSHQLTKEVFFDRRTPFSPIRNEKQRRELHHHNYHNHYYERAQTARSESSNCTKPKDDREREAAAFFASTISYPFSPGNDKTENKNYRESSSSYVGDDYQIDDPVSAFMDKGEPRSATVRTTSRGTARFWPKPPVFPVEPVFCEIVPPRTFIVTEASLKAAAQKARREELMKSMSSKNPARRFELSKSIEDAAKRAVWMAKQAEKVEAQKKEQEEELKKRENEERRRKRERVRREKRMRAALGMK